MRHTQRVHGKCARNSKPAAIDVAEVVSLGGYEQVDQALQHKYDLGQLNISATVG